MINLKPVVFSPLSCRFKRALSAAYGGGCSSVAFFLVWKAFPSRNFHFGRPKSNFSGFKKWGHLGPFDVIACGNFPFPFSLFFFIGPLFFGGGSDNNILGGGPVSSCRHCWLLNPPLSPLMATHTANIPSSKVRQSLVLHMAKKSWPIAVNIT